MQSDKDHYGKAKKKLGEDEAPKEVIGGGAKGKD